MEDKHVGHLMIKNATLLLCQLQIPEDIMFVYERCVCTFSYYSIFCYICYRCVRLLVKCLRDNNNIIGIVGGIDGNATMTQRIAVFLLNTMACTFDHEHKICIGNMGTIEVWWCA
jgi:hypothetical protein